MIDIGLISYGVAAAAFGALGGLLLRQWHSPIGPAVICSSLITAAWAALIALGTLAEYPPIRCIQAAELIRNAFWILLLLQLNSLQSGSDIWAYNGWRWRGPLAFATAAAFAVMTLEPLLLILGFSPPAYTVDLQLSIWLMVAVGGLLLVEQLYRNASPTGRWSSKFICLGIGAFFAYDFFMYAEALLFRQLNPELWRARGLAMAVAVPWLAVGLVRQRASQIDLHVSRQVVFHSVTLVAAGLYLLCMALIGYYIRFRGGDWGGVLQLGFFAGAMAGLLSLLFSGRLRANLRVQLEKHFFSYRYDYRDEWLKYTSALAGLSDDVPEGIVQTMAPLVGSNAGLLFARQKERFSCVAHWNMPSPSTDDDLGNAPDWMAERGWVVDLRELARAPEIYGSLALPSWLREREDIWLLVPLIFRDQISAILILKAAELKSELNWEDRDLLKTAGRQAATHLAQFLANRALVEARQFDAFNRLSAYVVHDLKNILAQQSLMIANADKHKTNPAFVDDMIMTVANSVKRMQRLMDQMRSGIREQPSRTIDLIELLHSVVQERSSSRPEPELLFDRGACSTRADGERLLTVFSHLVQNAQEATSADGFVRINLETTERWISVTIEDNGVGMSSEFVRDRLFKPFDSTKGLTGMGIGAFESREYVRQLGGDITVESTPGRGSRFIVALPRSSADDPGDDLSSAALNRDSNLGK